MATPTITSLSNVIGPIGQWVYIDGTNFDINNTRVYFNTTECSYPKINSDVQLVVEVPDTADTTGYFKVVTSEGEFTTDILYTIGTPTQPPTITTVYPYSDPTYKWCYVDGNNFVTYNTTITYNNNTSRVITPVGYGPTQCGFGLETEGEVVTQVTLTTPNGVATWTA